MIWYFPVEYKVKLAMNITEQICKSFNSWSLDEKKMSANVGCILQNFLYARNI